MLRNSLLTSQVFAAFAADDDRAGAADGTDGAPAAAPAAGADGRVSPAAADADSGPLGDSLGVDFIDDDGALDDDAAEAHRGLKRGRGEEPGSGPRSAYVGSLVRACTLAEAAPGALRAPTAPEAEAKRLLCLGALGRLQSLMQRWKKGPLQPF